MSLIALIAPDATINRIEDWKVVDKYKPKIPSTIPPGILKCPNPSCITYDGKEPVEPKFYVEKYEDRISVKCWYCNRELEGSILEYLV